MVIFLMELCKSWLIAKEDARVVGILPEKSDIHIITIMVIVIWVHGVIIGFEGPKFTAEAIGLQGFLILTSSVALLSYNLMLLIFIDYHLHKTILYFF